MSRTIPNAPFEFRIDVQSSLPFRHARATDASRSASAMDRRADELVERGGRPVRPRGLRRDLDGRARGGARHRRRRRSTTTSAARRSCCAGSASSSPSRCTRAREDALAGLDDPADRLRALVARVGPARRRAPRPHARLPAGAPRHRARARSGATSARAASASRGWSTACSPTWRTARARFADRRVALSALLGMVNHTAQWFSPRGRLSAGEVAAGYAGLLVA